MLPVERVFFRTRLERAQFIAARLHGYITGKILDVGCDEAHLKSLLSLQDYVGIDVGGKPDLLLNLERIDRLPFADDSFDCVICCEVLEHLDNLYFIFAELVRVSRRYLIISLPNNWGNARRPIERGRGSIGHYGLPLRVSCRSPQMVFRLERGETFSGWQSGRKQIEGAGSPLPRKSRATDWCALCVACATRANWPTSTATRTPIGRFSLSEHVISVCFQVETNSPRTMNGRSAGRCASFWSAATESSEVPLLGGDDSGLGELRSSERCQCGDLQTPSPQSKTWRHIRRANSMNSTPFETTLE